MNPTLQLQATGLPANYDSLLLLFIDTYFLVAPFAWANSMGWYTPAMVVVVWVLMMGLTEMGSSLEDPFGMDPSDLPLEKYCTAIELQLAAVTKRHTAGVDLALAPSRRPTGAKMKTRRLIRKMNTGLRWGSMEGIGSGDKYAC